jgi:hypothetical protein
MVSTRMITTRGHHYLQQVKSEWDPEKKRAFTKVLSHLGPCDKDGNLLRATQVRVDNIHSAFPVGHLAILYAAAKELHVAEHIASTVSQDAAKLLLCLVLNQATARVPIYHLPEWVSASPLPKWEGLDKQSISSRRFEEALTALCHLTPYKTWEDRGLILQNKLTHAWRGSSREPAGAYYDITKQLYYGTQCPYSQIGHDERGTAPVIGFGMVVSKEHRHPILCQALPGGQNDSLSVVSTLEMLQAQGLRGLTLVMDRGMTAKDNVRRIIQAGYHVVGCTRGWNEEKASYASQWQDDKLERQEYVVGTSHGGAVYARAFTAPLMGFPKMRIAVVENISQKAEERKARDLLLQELEGPLSKDRLREIRKDLGSVIINSRGRRGFSINQQAVNKERSLDGRFLLFSTDLSMDGWEMYKTYFARDAIEKVFRTSRGELSLGPVRYRRKDRLDAYASVIHMSYLLWSWAERRLKQKYPELGLSEAMRIVENVSWIKFGTDKFVREWTTRPTIRQEQILSAVGAIQYLARY